jgi:molybdenum cofactor cytidylyltransferase
LHLPFIGTKVAGMTTSSSGPIAIILAGGAGQRMGLPKALLENEKGKSFLGTLVSTFTKAGCRVLVVTGKHTAEILAHHPELESVDNPRWEEGQYSSVRVGLEAALEGEPSAVLLHPVDMPMIRPATVTALLDALDVTVEGVVPEFEGAPGHPLVLSASAARRVVAMDDVPHLEAAQQRLNMIRLKTRDPAVLVNINSPEVYQRVLGGEPHLAPIIQRKRKGKGAQPADAKESPTG